MSSVPLQAPNPLVRAPLLTDEEVTACARASLDNAGQVNQWLFARAIERAVLAKFVGPVAYRTLVGDYGDFQKYNYDETSGEHALYSLAAPEPEISAC